MSKESTPLQKMYEKYEEFRSCKTAEEHANKFLAWMLTQKEVNLQQEKMEFNIAFNAGSNETWMELEKGNPPIYGNGFKYCSAKFKPSND